MPPVRNIAAIKPVKTERTHEENQERAYIAASRRSDRSLEARIESARRASEIHKKRTGRALRVTEQDVINEEMYEEEDEDLPAQYRRLTAHLQTGSMDFNRRFQAYIQSHAGTRMALASYDPSFANGYMQQQQYPTNQAFNPQFMQMLPTHMISPQISTPSPQFYRHSPYPITPPQPYPSPTHQRSASVALPQEISAYPAAYSQPGIPSSRPEEQRRMSLPAQMMPLSTPLPTPPIQPQMSQPPPSVHSVKADSPHHSPGAMRNDSISPTEDNVVKQQPDDQSQAGFFAMTTQAISMPCDPSTQHFNTSPFSYALPPESQMALGQSVEQNGFPAAMFMAGSELLPQQNFYSYNPNTASKTKTSQDHLQDPSQDPSMGMTGTTIPPHSAPLLDTTSDGLLVQGPPSATTTVASDGLLTPYTPIFSHSFPGMDPGCVDGMKSHIITTNNSSQSSANGDWDTFLEYDQPVWQGDPLVN